MSAPLTTTHWSGMEVLAKMFRGRALPKSYANRTQAQTAADKAGEGWAVFQKGRPFFVGKAMSADDRQRARDLAADKAWAASQPESAAAGERYAEAQDERQERGRCSEACDLGTRRMIRGVMLRPSTELAE